jgi:hypothetical protein
MADRCKTCKAPIRWAVTTTGHALAAARGRGGTPQAVYVAEAQRSALTGSLYMAHWATCPYADEHRKRP